MEPAAEAFDGRFYSHCVGGFGFIILQGCMAWCCGSDGCGNRTAPWLGLRAVLRLCADGDDWGGTGDGCLFRLDLAELIDLECLDVIVIGIECFDIIVIIIFSEW